jgi:hypothetical protein
MQEFRKSPNQSHSVGNNQSKRSQVKTEQKAALDDTAKLPAIPPTPNSSKKQGFTKEQILEVLKIGRLELGRAFGLKGDALARCATTSSLPAAAAIRLKPFEDKAKLVLGKASLCVDAVKRMEEALGVTVKFTDLLLLAHHPKFVALHAVRDHAKTQAFFKHIKGTPGAVFRDKLLSIVLPKSRENGDMRAVVKIIENMSKNSK